MVCIREPMQCWILANLPFECSTLHTQSRLSLSVIENFHFLLLCCDPLCSLQHYSDFKSMKHSQIPWNTLESNEVDFPMSMNAVAIIKAFANLMTFNWTPRLKEEQKRLCLREWEKCILWDTVSDLNGIVAAGLSFFSFVIVVPLPPSMLL